MALQRVKRWQMRPITKCGSVFRRLRSKRITMGTVITAGIGLGVRQDAAVSCALLSDERRTVVSNVEAVGMASAGWDWYMRGCSVPESL